jgi:hypothetical protein
MVFGRPSMLNRASTSRLMLPRVFNEEDLSSFASDLTDPHLNHRSYMSFWVEAVKLVQIAADIIESVYPQDDVTHNPEQSNVHDQYHAGFHTSSRLVQGVKAGNFEDYVRHDRDLAQWHNDLPSFLLFQPSLTATGAAATFDEILSRQAKVLELRYAISLAGC